MKADAVIDESLNNMLKLSICKAVFKDGADGPSSDIDQLIRMG
jgi:hypothetical protein